MDRGLILKNDLSVPVQVTTKELYVLANATSKLSFAKKGTNKLVLLSVIRGAILLSYQESTLGSIDKSPTYWRTTNGLGLIVFVAKLLPSNLKSVYGNVNTPLLLT